MGGAFKESEVNILKFETYLARAVEVVENGLVDLHEDDFVGDARFETRFVSFGARLHTNQALLLDLFRLGHMGRHG